MPRHRRLALLLLLLLIAGWLFGLPRLLDWDMLSEHRARMVEAVHEHPLLSAAGFVAVYVVAVTLSMPGAFVITIAGGMLFGTWTGTALSVAGATTGAVMLFLIVRHALAEAVAPWIARLARRVAPGVAAELRRDGVSYLLAIRLVPLFPFWIVNLGAALSGMRLAPFVLATLPGIVPATAIFASIGAGLGDAFVPGVRPELSAFWSPRIVLGLAGLAALALLPVAARQWQRLAQRLP
jgi:uncharacterized membrane protein YdjX (TVP38/TMEM64 family)